MESIQNEYTNTINTIYGFAIADALGVPAEFKDRLYLEKYPITDMVGYGTHNMPEGTWSDDTSMTIAELDSIGNKGTIDYNDIMNNYVKWVKNAEYTGTGVFFDIGNTTRVAISNFVRGMNPIECGEKTINSNGNGSLMRMIPFVLYLLENPMSEAEEVEFINNASSLTHAHEISKLGCYIYTQYLKLLLEGKTKEEAYDELKMFDYKKFYSEDSIQRYKRIINGDIPLLTKEQIKSSGYVVDTLEASIWCTLKSSNYKDSALEAVNLGEDTDTVAAITGSMLGVIYGYESIPQEWINKLKNKEYLTNLCKKFDDKIKRKEDKLSL